MVFRGIFMRSKTIISILAFAVAFGFSTYFASFFLPESVESQTFYYENTHISTQPDSEIMSFLRRDISNGNERISSYFDSGNEHHEVSPENCLAHKAASVKFYSEKSASMDATELPKDFRAAWRKHMKAWRDYSNFLDKSAKSSNLDSEDFNEKSAEFNDEISSTWNDVLDIGESYDENVRFEIQ
jgi:hypothetical protein